MCREERGVTRSAGCGKKKRKERYSTAADVKKKKKRW